MKVFSIAFVSVVLASEQQSTNLRRRTQADGTDPRTISVKTDGKFSSGANVPHFEAYQGAQQQAQSQQLFASSQVQQQVNPPQQSLFSNQGITQPQQMASVEQQQQQPQQQQQYPVGHPQQQQPPPVGQQQQQKSQQQQQQASTPQQQQMNAIVQQPQVTGSSQGAGNQQQQQQQPAGQQPQASEGASQPETRQRRKFVSYSSSEWELMWLNNVDQWENEQKICEVLLQDQARYIHDYLSLMCSSRVEPPYDNWCVIDDSYLPLWYNTQNRQNLEISWGHPDHIPDNVVVPPRKPVIPGPEHSHVASKFVFLDEVKNEYYVEYIEPLISHLRFPLSKCVSPPAGKEELKYHDTLFRGWLIPPPPVLRGDRAVYVDAGDSSWDKGIKTFNNVWQRSGIMFDETFAFDSHTTREDFFKTIPKDVHSTVHFKQCMVASHVEEHTQETPFMPQFINRQTKLNDYVLLKLDIGHPDVEAGNIEYILSDPNNKIDEVVWEHHVSGNYLMAEHWQSDVSQLSLRQSYDYFLRMRQKGIRAHSWV